MNPQRIGSQRIGSQCIESLTLADRRLLRAVQALVPAPLRDEWQRTWQAELCDMHQRKRSRRERGLSFRADLSAGLVRDAIWLRTESWRRLLSGTATLCVGSLVALCLLATLVGLALSGDWNAFALSMKPVLERSLAGAPLVVFVTFATGPRWHLEPNVSIRQLRWVRRQLFLAIKLLLVLLLAMLSSADLCRPFHALYPATADLLQIFFFVLFSVVGLRWALEDQAERCKHCLHLLGTPARVGRPSHNLLEWNGTELACKQGHGLLNVPEMQTSWCEFSQWVDLGA